MHTRAAIIMPASVTDTLSAEQVRALDLELFSHIETATSAWDRRALLALHAAVADVCDRFTYLEIGSHLGGSLQVVMRDPRCHGVISIDPRPADTPDARGEPWPYPDNTTGHMLELLSAVPGVDLAKLTTLEASTSELDPRRLPTKPDYCLIDGEHTHDAVLRDACFCAEALEGNGVIAFHDYTLIGSAIGVFLRDNWSDISFALAFSGPIDPTAGMGIFAIELGDRGVLRHRAIDQAVGSKWHSAVWRLANRSHRPLAFLWAWALVPAVDSFVVHARHGLRGYVRGR